MTDPRWDTEDSVDCVVCPVCAFTFDARHVTDSTGEYDCPVCAETRLRDALTAMVDANTNLRALPWPLARAALSPEQEPK